MAEDIFQKYNPKVDISYSENEELKDVKDRVDKINGDGELIDVNSFKIYKATYDINVFVENDSEEVVHLEQVQCIYLAKTDAIARIMSMNELCKQSQYEFVSIRDAVLDNIICVTDGDRVVVSTKK